MNTDQWCECEDAVENLALQISNLWDDPECVDWAREVVGRIYPSGRADLSAFRDHVLSTDAVRGFVERVREWCDFTESALTDAEEAFGE